MPRRPLAARNTIRHHRTSQAATTTDDLWKALSNVNDWVRHADAKAGAALTFTCVLAAMIYNLLHDFTKWSLPLGIFCGIICVVLTCAMFFCGKVLFPRINGSKANNDENNLLYFQSISRNYKNRPTSYERALLDVARNPSKLSHQLAQQIHVNAHIATVKTQMVQYAIRAALVSAVLVAVLAVVVTYLKT